MFAREGAKVMAVDLAEGPVQETVDLIVGGGGEASSMTADVSRAEEVQRMGVGDGFAVRSDGCCVQQRRNPHRGRESRSTNTPRTNGTE